MGRFQIDPVDPVPDLRLYGVSLGHLSGVQQVGVLFGAILFWFTIQGICTERITRSGFKLPWTAGFIEMLLFACFSFGETLLCTRHPVASMERDLESGMDEDVEPSHQTDATRRPNLPPSVLGSYGVVAAGLTLARGLTWVMIARVSFPTALLIKSSKLIAVMVGGVVFLRKKYGIFDYAAALTLTLGLYLFTQGDINTKGKDGKADTFFGIVCGIISLAADALVSNMQERTLQANKRSVTEMLLYTNTMSTILLAIIAVLLGEATPAIEFFTWKPSSSSMLLVAAVAGYLGLAAWTTTIKSFGALLTTGCGIIRKFVNLAFSFFLFPKPFVFYHAVGLLLFFGGLGVSYWQSRVRHYRATQSWELNPV